MRKQNHVGLDIRDGVDVGGDPSKMFGEALGQAQHRNILLVPFCARETGRQIAALGLDGELPPNDPDGGSLPGKPIGQEPSDVADHNIPSAFDCALWPIRMGTFPWRAPVSDTRREHGRQMGLKMTAERSEPPRNGNSTGLSAAFRA